MTARSVGRSLPTGVRILVGAALLLAVAPAGADWLVLRDGSRLETRGRWEERGRRIVFTAADGTLSSLKVDQVDLAASRRATAEAVAPARRPPAPAAGKQAPRKAARRWTNADIAPGRTEPPAVEEGQPADGEAAAEGSGEEGRPASPVIVDGWEVGESLDGVVLLGRLRNTSDAVVAAAVRVEVVLFDREGRRLAEKRASVVPTTLPAGGTGEFRVEFPGIYDYSLVRFDVASTNLGSAEGASPRTARPGAETDEGAGASP